MAEHMVTYERAVEAAIAGHADQFRAHTGEPFIVHPLRVAARLTWPMFEEDDAYDARVAAVLHDSIDAGHARLDETTLHFGRHVLTLTERQAAFLDAVTRREGESDALFFARVLAVRGARWIVIADCEENLADLPTPHPQRAAYEAAIKVLSGHIER
ncbi:MAG TPA: HD domain-containing protein [Candidatus Limnocylindria bacterium]|nr:HD domain-containing protein [Candidatus Limnocylindria bacterium]